MGEEIAVMREGGVVQIGTPDELYENPKDTYVAGKIGSPHMNMIRGKTTKGRSAFESKFGALALGRKLVTAEAGGESILGIRPSDLRFAGKGEKGHDVNIAMLEPLGDVTVVSVEAHGETLRLILPESAATSLAPGQAASIYLDPKKFHIFRASSGQALS